MCRLVFQPHTLELTPRHNVWCVSSSTMLTHKAPRCVWVCGKVYVCDERRQTQTHTHTFIHHHPYRSQRFRENPHSYVVKCIARLMVRNQGGWRRRRIPLPRSCSTLHTHTHGFIVAPAELSTYEWLGAFLWGGGGWVCVVQYEFSIWPSSHTHHVSTVGLKTTRRSLPSRFTLSHQQPSHIWRVIAYK